MDTVVIYGHLSTLLLGDDNSDKIVTDGDIAINFMNISSNESNEFGCDSIHNGDYMVCDMFGW